MSTTLHSEYDSKTIQELIHLFNNGQLNLEPGFQRESVWIERDRRKLIESIFQNYPIPSIFLYKQSHDGRLTYDVIDGKQRLESLLMFQGLGRFRGQRFSIRFPLEETEGMAEWDWSRVCRRGHEHRLMGYKIQTAEVSGEFSDIIDLFVRINSTGKRLAGAEKRHAKYYHSEFLKKAGKLAEAKIRFFEDNRVLSKGQISRMKHVELVCELLASIHSCGPINKKKMDELVFMQDMCEVVISTSDDPNADPLPTIIVDNGAKRYIAAFVRGVPKFVPRYIVERLARMKKTDFGNKQVKDEETGELSYEHPETNTWVYPFLVKTDPAGQKGRDWLTKVMAERQ